MASAEEDSNAGPAAPAGDVQLDIDDALLAVAAGPEALVQKRGSHGARVHLRTGERLDTTKDCANFMAREDEIEAFVAVRGGL